jgi:hypothetical protein
MSYIVNSGSISLCICATCIALSLHISFAISCMLVDLVLFFCPLQIRNFMIESILVMERNEPNISLVQLF